jgi:hypothetical protein
MTVDLSAKGDPSLLCRSQHPLFSTLLGPGTSEYENYRATPRSLVLRVPAGGVGPGWFGHSECAGRYQISATVFEVSAVSPVLGIPAGHPRGQPSWLGVHSRGESFGKGETGLPHNHRLLEEIPLEEGWKGLPDMGMSEPSPGRRTFL